MNGFEIFSTTALVALALAALIAAAAASRRSWGPTADRLAGRVGLALPESLARSVATRARRTTTAWLIGASVGLLGAALLGLAPATLYPGLLIGIALSVTGGSVAAGLVAAAAGLDRTPPGPRLARTRRVGIGDYVMPAELIAARLFGFGGAAFGLVVFLSDARGVLAVDSWTFALLAVASVVLFEVGGRRIVGRAQRAATDAALAWDDALRALDLRALATAPSVAGIWAFVLALQPLADATAEQLGRGGGLVVAGVLLAMVLAVVLVFVFAAARKPQQHYLRRLWPELAAAR